MAFLWWKKEIQFHFKLHVVYHQLCIFVNCNIVIYFFEIEMDASFKAVRPYSFCVTKAIYNNESYPISLSIISTETEQLYELVVENLTKVGIDKKLWNEKYLLSDMGSSLISFGSRFFKFRFFCHRHRVHMIQLRVTIFNFNINTLIFL